MSASGEFAVFEYLYRDAGNWKTWGQVLVGGAPTPDDISSLTACFESGEFFIAEKLGIPTLFRKFWNQYGGPTQDDHPWHEFAGVRPATQVEISQGLLWGSMQTLIERANSITAWEPYPK